MREKEMGGGGARELRFRQKNTKDGDGRSVQPLKIQHSQCSGPDAVCSVTSTAAASAPPPSLAAGDQWIHTFTLGRGWCCYGPYVWSVF